MFTAASSRDRPVHSAIAVAAMVFLIFSLVIFQASVVRSATPQSQSGFGFVQIPLPLPLPLPNPMWRSMQSQPSLANHTQHSVNYTQQSVNHIHVSNDAVTEVAASDATVIPDQYIIVLKSGAHPHASSIVDKVKNSAATIYVGALN